MGLCGDNNNNSPPVIVTDTNEHVFVVMLTLDSDLPLTFSLSCRRCADLSSALHLAAIEGKLCKSYNFCRPPTPDDF